MMEMVLILILYHLSQVSIMGIIIMTAMDVVMNLDLIWALVLVVVTAMIVMLLLVIVM